MSHARIHGGATTASVTRSTTTRMDVESASSSELAKKCKCCSIGDANAYLYTYIQVSLYRVGDKKVSLIIVAITLCSAKQI